MFDLCQAEYFKLTGGRVFECRGMYADIPYVSESVYLQVDASEQGL